MPNEMSRLDCLSAQLAASEARNVPEASHRPRDPILSIVRRAVERVGGLFRVWRTRMRESQELSRLSDRELRDMNLSRYDVAHAERRPFWKA